MKNKLFRRISAAFVAICIAVSLMPAVFADGTVTKTYKFYANGEDGALATNYTGKANAVTKSVGHSWYFKDIDDQAYRVAVTGDLATYGESYSKNERVMQLQADDLRMYAKRTTGSKADPSYELVNGIQIAFVLKAPETAGFYRVEGKGKYTSQLYLDKNDARADVEDYMIDKAKFYSSTNFGGSSTNYSTAAATKQLNGIVYSDGASELLLAIDTLDSSTTCRYFRELTLVKIEPTISLEIENTTLEIGGTTKATVYARSTETTATNQRMLNSFVEYSCSDNLTIDELGNITAEAAGPATITATVGGVSYTQDISVTVPVPVENAEYTAAFNPDYTDRENVNEVVTPLVYAKDGTKLDITPSATENADGTWFVSTEATSGEYRFLYWAKGLSTGIKRRIVSRSASFNYDAENEGNYLIAVYEKENMKTNGDEYYNANGQLLENGNTLPYLAGYNGPATGWEDRGDGMHVAIFPEENRATYTITVDGTPKEYYYGEPVPCTADAEKDGKKFFGWRKTVNGAPAELVSASTTYTFNAWETCEVTAVYEDEEPVFSGVARKIVLGTFNVGNETAIMAEFIGFGNDVVERGISLNGTQIAMTTKEYNQFTIINNDNLPNISGYAILEDGTKLIYNK